MHIPSSPKVSNEFLQIFSVLEFFPEFHEPQEYTLTPQKFLDICKIDFLSNLSKKIQK